MNKIKKIDISWSHIGKLNIVKTSVPFNLIYRFNSLPVKISKLFVDTDKLILKLMVESPQIQSSQHNIERE